jgi:uncharacterized cupredoxin-like copper-binding protein
MKYFAILGLLLATPIVIFTTHVVVAETTQQPVSVNIELLRENGEFKIKSSLMVFKVGVPYRFKVYNAGNVKHDWAIMPRGETDLRQALVAIEEDNLPPNAAVTSEVVTFDRAGEFEFACHYRNHYQKGMKTPFTVR